MGEMTHLRSEKRGTFVIGRLEQRGSCLEGGREERQDHQDSQFFRVRVLLPPRAA